MSAMAVFASSHAKCRKRCKKRQYLAYIPYCNGFQLWLPYEVFSVLPPTFKEVCAMATRLVFLAVVCVGSVAFGQAPSNDVPAIAMPTICGKSRLPAPKTAAHKTPAPATPAPTTTPTPASPTGFTMHFHMGGNFDASFEMNVTQGKEKQTKQPKANKQPKAKAAE